MYTCILQNPLGGLVRLRRSPLERRDGAGQASWASPQLSGAAKPLAFRSALAPWRTLQSSCSRDGEIHDEIPTLPTILWGYCQEGVSSQGLYLPASLGFCVGPSDFLPETTWGCQARQIRARQASPTLLFSAPLAAHTGFPGSQRWQSLWFPNVMRF